MFKQKKWIFVGASGAKYVFSLLPKSRELPRSPGVFILAYTHPRGHLAGWQVNPLRLGHADDVSRSVGDGAGLDSDNAPLWNSNFVLLESDPLAREACVRDLEPVELMYG